MGVPKYKNIQRVDLDAQRRQGELILGKGNRSEFQGFGRILRDVPNLVTVILGVCLPRNDETVTILSYGRSKAEFVVEHSLLFRYVKAIEEFFEFPATLGALHWRVSHTMRDMMNMRRGIKPVCQIFFRGFMKLAEVPAFWGLRF